MVCDVQKPDNRYPVIPASLAGLYLLFNDPTYF